MPRIIVIANQKGGVGKTTTVANLGAALSKLGHQVAMIDLDPQGALTVSFGFDPYSIKPSTYDLLLSNDFPLDGILRELPPSAYLAPANTELIATEYRLLKEPDRTFRLKNSIARSNRGIDYILIDTPPGLGLLTINALVSANELLIPVATDYLAMRGVRSLMESVWFIRERINPDLRLLGLVPTLYRKDSPHANAVISEMRKVFKHKVMRTYIPQDEAASAAPAARKSVLDYQPASKVATAFIQLAKEIDHGQ
jgi:chromosome partitioning protein